MFDRTNLAILWLLVLIGLLFVFERAFPLRKSRFSLGRRLAINLVLSACTFAVAAAVVAPTISWIFSARSPGTLGLLNLQSTSGLVRGALAFLLLDLSFYYWHWANHRFVLLWRFHNVHHIDGDLDVSTGARFHPGEVALSSLFRIAQVVLIGVNLQEYLAYEAVFQCAVYFQHSNLRLPAQLDRFLAFVFVTPRMHGIHHSQFRDETNSNYSTVFSFWDRMHRSFRYDLSPSELVMGVPGYPAEEYLSIRSCLQAPFSPQRPYWMTPDGTSYFSRPVINNSVKHSEP